VVVEVDASNFEAMVLKAPVAVVLDCYADWCDPCRTLTPRLEAVVRASRGMVRLAKLNVDNQAEIAGQLGVRSLPTVMGIVGGKLVDQFQGAVPDAQLQAFFSKVAAAAEAAGMLRPGAAGGAGAAADPVAQINAALADAATAVDTGDAEAAVEGLPNVVRAIAQLRGAVEKKLTDEAAATAAAKGGAGAKPVPVRSDVGPLALMDTLMARTLAIAIRAALAVAASRTAAGNTDVAALYAAVRANADTLRTKYAVAAKEAEVVRALAAADLAAGAEGAAAKLAPLAAAAAAAPTDPDARYALAEAQLALGHHAAAIDDLLAVLKMAGPGWRDGAARTTLLKLFDTLGAAHPLTLSGRKALSKVLFR